MGSGSGSSKADAMNAFAKSEGSSLRKLSDGRILDTRTGKTSNPTGRYASSPKYEPQIQSEKESQIRILGQLYNQAKASGDMASADSWHNAANKIRQSMGLVAGVDYDEVSGARLTPNTLNNQPTASGGGYGGGYPEYQEIDNSALYKQQAKERAAQIRAAIQRQKTSAYGNIQGLESQYGTAIQTAQNQGAQLPGQFTQLNNQVSNRGQINAQRIRTAMAQMGLGQSGASASQQLEQNLATDNQINANNQQLQNLTTDISTQVSGLQSEKAAKIAQINQAIADAEAAGDEEAALALSNAQAQIIAEANQNAVGRNNWNLSIADRIRAAQQTAQEAANENAGFANPYERWRAEQELKLKNDMAMSDYDYAQRIRLAQEEARLRPASSGSTSDSRRVTTSQAIADLISMQDPRQARSLFQTNAATMAANGVDIAAVQMALARQWPDYFGAAKADPNNPGAMLPNVGDYWYSPEPGN